MISTVKDLTKDLANIEEEAKQCILEFLKNSPEGAINLECESGFTYTELDSDGFPWQGRTINEIQYVESLDAIEATVESDGVDGPTSLSYEDLTELLDAAQWVDLLGVTEMAYYKGNQS